MTASFAAYASQFLNRNQNPALSQISASQPLFYSFTTDNGSHIGDMSQTHDDMEFDDEDDPHLGRSNEYTSRRSLPPPDEDDPYLRLDDDEYSSNRPDEHRGTESIPLVRSLHASRGQSLVPGQGWLSHHEESPSSPSELSSDSGTPPPDFLHHIRPERTIVSGKRATAITESLLPRDGTSRPVDVFSLPDPRPASKKRMTHKDSVWIVAWLGSVMICVAGSFVVLFTTSVPRGTPERLILPYSVLLHTIPLLTILTFVCAALCYVHIFLLRVFVRPVIFATSVFIPATLFISAIWAFVGSFMWEEGVEPSWGESTGLRLFSLVPLIFAIVTARRLVDLPQEIHTASSVLSLSTSLLISNPFLLALSPLVLLITLIGSIPFFTLAFRLLLHGYTTTSAANTWEWHVRNWAGWAITATVCVWLWCWGVARGIIRVTCATVIGAWYFSSTDTEAPPSFDTYRLHAALTRSTDASLGSIALSALLLTLVRMLTLFSTILRRAPLPFLPFMTLPLHFIDNATGALSTLALVYVGLTGDAFFPSARRARTLTNLITRSGGKVKYRQSGADPSLRILQIAPLTLTFPFALGTYLFVAHTLGAPGYAPVGALLAGGITILVGRFCTGLVEDTADTLYLCYCIDRDTGLKHHGQVFDAIEWRSPNDLRDNPEPSPRVDSIHRNHSSISAEPVEGPAMEVSDVRAYSVGKSLQASTSSEEEENDESIMLGLDFV